MASAAILVSRKAERFEIKHHRIMIGRHVVADRNPTVRQRELGRRLRDLREDRKLTIPEVADKLMVSATKISRLETGTRPPNPRDVRDLCRHYELDDATTDELLNLARGAREQVWWTQYEDLKLDPYLGLEQEAVAITSYTTYYIPALLQTEEYTRAIIKAIAPKMDPDIYEQRVEARMRRQRVLEKDKPPRYRVLLDEAVLHHGIGGQAVMISQLDRVVEAQRLGKTAVHIIPFGKGSYVAQDSNFVLFEFEPESSLLPVVFVEGLTGNQYHERKVDVDRYREAIDHLRDSALRPDESVLRIDEVRKAYASSENDWLA
jgi:transcriptional regulator with XRE-family HTH domain